MAKPTEPITIETALKENKSVYSGHPAAGAGSKVAGGEAAEKEAAEKEAAEKEAAEKEVAEKEAAEKEAAEKEAAEKEAAEKEAAEKEATEKEAAEKEAAEKEAAEKEAAEKEAAGKGGKKKPAFKYVSHEEAERGAKDAETLMHEKAGEAKRERERASDLQTQLNDALIKISAKPAKLDEPKPTSADKMKELLDQVNALDPEAEDYNAKVAEIWGHREDDLRDVVDTKVKEALDAYTKKVKDEKSKADDELTTQKAIVSDAEIAGKAAGLDMKKGSDDSEMFWAFADKAPEGPIEDQIKWTVDKVKGIKAAYTAPETKKKEEKLAADLKAKAAQEKNIVLERSGEGKPVKTVIPDKPLGLATAFKQIERRI